MQKYKKFYFNYGRTALKAGLISIGFNKKNYILIPDFICDAVIQPLNELGINYKYYKTDKNLKPDLKHLKKTQCQNMGALMIINYFGINDDFSQFSKYCKKNSIYFILDNSHAFGILEDIRCRKHGINRYFSLR